MISFGGRCIGLNLETLRNGLHRLVLGEIGGKDRRLCIVELDKVIGHIDHAVSILEDSWCVVSGKVKLDHLEFTGRVELVVEQQVIELLSSLYAVRLAKVIKHGTCECLDEHDMVDGLDIIVNGLDTVDLPLDFVTIIVVDKVVDGDLVPDNGSNLLQVHLQSTVSDKIDDSWRV